MDVFDSLVAKDRIIPAGVQGISSGNYSFEEGCMTSVNRGCTAWVLYNENMDYLKCDDLSWSGKKKCK